jgi:hypothetical protein
MFFNYLTILMNYNMKKLFGFYLAEARKLLISKATKYRGYKIDGLS